MWLFQKSGPRTHPGPKNTEKWPQEGQNWRQCTSCGPTNWFWAKKNKFESVRSKVCSFHSESARGNTSRLTVANLRPNYTSETSAIVAQNWAHTMCTHLHAYCASICLDICMFWQMLCKHLHTEVSGNSPREGNHVQS